MNAKNSNIKQEERKSRSCDLERRGKKLKTRNPKAAPTKFGDGICPTRGGRETRSGTEKRCSHNLQCGQIGSSPPATHPVSDERIIKSLKHPYSVQFTFSQLNRRVLYIRSFPDYQNLAKHDYKYQNMIQFCCMTTSLKKKMHSLHLKETNCCPPS